MGIERDVPEATVARLPVYRRCLLELAATGETRKPVFVFAQDTRHFSEEFASYCAKVASELGCDAYLFDGPRATPTLDGDRLVQSEEGN